MHWINWAIVVAYLAVSVAIGLLANRFITGITGYLVAGRSLGTALSIATMTGSAFARADLLGRRGGTMAIDFIKAVG